MPKEICFSLENLDCPACAAKIESKVISVTGVKAASVDVINRKLAITCKDGEYGDVSHDIEQTIKEIDPNISFSEIKIDNTGTGHDNEENGAGRLIMLIAGILVYAAGLALLVFHLPEIAVVLTFAVSGIISGGKIYIKAARNIVKGKIFDENFLMSAAAIGAFAIGEFAEGAAIVLFYQIGEFFQDMATEKSKKSISELMNLRPDYANLQTKEGMKRVSPYDVRVGEIIVVKPGERVPLDGVIIDGSSFVDTSSLTGEPVPRQVAIGDNVSGGFVNGDGLLTIKVLKEFGESTAAKIIDLVENSSIRKAKSEKFITRFARVYTPVVVTLATLIAVFPPLIFSQPYSIWISRAIVFIVVSCPCAVVISVPLAYFAGIGAASYNGILVKGGDYLEKLGKVKNVVFDKTGTLSKGVFKVVGTVCTDGITESQLLDAAALAQAASSHPIAKSIAAAAGKEIDRQKIKSCSEIAGMGVITKTDNGTIAAGNEKLMLREGVKFDACSKKGTIVYVAKDGIYMGCVIISDVIKEEAKSAVKSLYSLGVKKIAILTGDRQSAAKAAAEQVGITEVYAELLPTDKAETFKKISESGITAYVGDGINDAPVLAEADIGIAMGGAGSDAAVEAADMVIMNDNPEKLSSAIRISRYVGMVTYQNIIFALGVKFAVLILGALGCANIWEAVFADTGVTLLAVMNSLRVLIRRTKFS